MTLRDKVMRALSWSAVGQALNTLSALIVSVILARMLTPHDFGMVAMAIGVQTVLASLVDFGFVQLIIRTQQLTSQQLGGLFVARLGIGLLQGAVMFGLSRPLAVMLQHPELQPVIEWLSAISVLSAFTMIPEALLRKQLDFKRLTIASVAASVTAGGLGIVMALYGYGLWSLVAQFLASIAVNAILLHFVCQWRPAGAPDFTVLHQHSGFIGNSYGLNIVGALVLQGDKLILGRLLGADILGLYVRGFGLVQQVQGFAATIAEQVGFSALSHGNDDLDQTRRRFLRIVAAVAHVTAPVMFMMAVLAEPIVLTLYGAQWAPSIPILQLAALALFINAINLPWDPLLRALGRVDVLFRWSLIDGSTRLAGLSIGAVLGGAKGAAIGFLLTALASFLLRAFVMGKAAGISARKFFGGLANPFLDAFIVMLATGISLHASAGLQDFLRLISGCLVGVGAYLTWKFVLGKKWSAF